MSAADPIAAGASADDLSLMALLFDAGRRQEVPTEVVTDILLEALQQNRPIEVIVDQSDLLSRRQREIVRRLLEEGCAAGDESRLSGRRSTLRNAKIGHTALIEGRGSDRQAAEDQTPADASLSQNAERSNNQPAEDLPERTQQLPGTAGDVQFEAECARSLPVGAGRYTEVAEIGRGGWGVVVRSFDRQLERDVAVKKLGPEAAAHPEIRRRFLHEARITAQLQHPGIVPVYERGISSADRQPYYAMKLLDGVTLRDVIRDYHALPAGAEKRRRFTSLLNSLVDVCQAVAYAHSRDIIHRDLKPANVVIGEFGETIVVDWGLARHTDPSSDAADSDASGDDDATVRGGTPMIRSTPPTASPLDGLLDPVMTQQGSVIGTPAFMSPEQARGAQSEIDHRTDTYALGAILYVILTGQSPFQSDNVETTLKQVISGEVRNPRTLNRSVPLPLASVCLKAMSRDRDDRYQDAAEIAAEINRFLNNEPVSAHRDTLPERVVRCCRRYPTIAATTVVGTLILAIAGATTAIVVGRAHHKEQQAHQKAVEAHAGEVAARRSAEDSHRRTLVLLEDSRRVADTWLIELSGTLERYPGMQPVREDLLQRAMTYYGELGTAADGDASLQTERARCLMRLADLHLLTGDAARAEECFGNSLQILASVPEADDSVVLLQREKVNAEIGLALCAVNTGTFTPEYAEKLSSVVSSLRDLTTESHDVAEVQNTLARGYLTVGRGQESLGANSAAVDAMEQALRWAERLTAHVPLPRFLALLGTVREDLARNYQAVNRRRDAARVLQDHMAATTEQLSDCSNRPDLLESRALTAMQWAGLQRHLSEDWAAEEAYRNAVKDLSDAWQLLFGERFYCENLAIAQANLGQMSLQLNRPDEAESLLREAVDQLTGLVRNGQGDRETVSRMAECNVSLGDVLLLLGHAGAEGQIRRSIDVYDYLRREAAVTAEDVAAQSRAMRNLAQLQRRSGRSDEAEQTLKQNLILLASVQTDDSRTRAAVTNLQAVTRLELSEVLTDRGAVDEAADCHAAAVTTLQESTATEAIDAAVRDGSATMCLLSAWLECGVELRNPDAAADLLNKIGRDSDLVGSVGQLAAITAYRQGHADDALRQMERVIRSRRFPDCTDAAIRGCIFAVQGLKSQADECLVQAAMGQTEQPGNLRLSRWVAELRSLTGSEDSGSAPLDAQPSDADHD
ncbi:MAG: serine/threonine protein kinase [Planctomycetaceae bacterium]|nr:serine/threonine protein kinase [Planctomycetaceae bacterium]